VLAYHKLLLRFTVDICNKINILCRFLPKDWRVKREDRWSLLFIWSVSFV
jgi:hypothetical protein